jgi:hypothetical protein
MKAREVITMILITCWLGVLPAAARDCCHHEHDRAYGNDCNHDYDHEAQGSHHCYGWTPTAGAAEMRTADGKITEVVYLPGATPDSGKVEVRLQSAGQSQLIRLGPVGFLKRSGVLLREGDTISVKGFPIAGMEGDLLVATELHKGEKTLSLRDTRGRPAW